MSLIARIVPRSSILALSVFACSALSACNSGSILAAGSPPPPVGHYGCYSAPVMIAIGGAFGTNIHQLGQWQGDVWILNSHQYAGPYHKDDVGNYVMNGDTLVAKTGSYAPPRNSTDITLTPARGSSPASLSIVFLDNGKPLIGTTCVWKDNK